MNANQINVSTHSRPKAAGKQSTCKTSIHVVSTHSRPKAAGRYTTRSTSFGTCFNTQPPEGGWFQSGFLAFQIVKVSTHSRPKAAGLSLKLYIEL